MKTFIIIDGNALIHRAYHALPPLKTKKGELVNAVYGFASILFRVLKELKPDYLAVTFDLAEPTFRKLEYEAYKAKRVKPDQEMYDQIPKIRELVQALNIPIYEAGGFEADDVIGAVVERLKKHKPAIKTMIVTGDLDTLQLVDEQTEVYFLKSGIKNTVVYDKKTVKENYHLEPEQLVGFKGLKGDPSDNIQGVPGIGQKTALELIKEFHSLENLYKKINQSGLKPQLKARLLEYKDQAFFSQYLAIIRKDVPLDFDLKKCQWFGFRENKNKLISFLEGLEFRSLIKRLEE